MTMGWFLKSKPEAEKKEFQKRKLMLCYSEQEMDVGRTIVEVTFRDGKKMKTCVYGHVMQDASSGQDETHHYPFVEAYALHPKVRESLLVAQEQLRYGSGESALTVVDDEFNPKANYTGVVLSKKILKSSSYMQKYMRAYTAPIEEVIK
jgi:hypothetical protein